MIAIKNLTKSFGPKTLLQNINLTINPGEKIGLIGPNGAGKTTLFSLILGDAEPSAGEIEINKNVYLGYLPQEARFSSSRSTLGEIMEGDERIMRLSKEKEKLEEENAADSKRYGEVLHELEVLGYFELEHKAKKILMGLGFKERDFNRFVSELSGGWQMRVLLAKLLTYQYSLLLLDEPTNYLDLNAALWLKDYLRDFKGTFMMISHDKAFLADVTNYTLILESGKIFKVRGNYEHYQQIKEERQLYLSRQSKEQDKKRKQLERFVERFHAQPNKAASVRAKRRVLERLEEEMIELPPDPRKSIRDFRFPPTQRSGHRVMALEKISKAYGDVKVYQDFDFEITQGEKAVLVGENGAGKSTLLKILAGVTDIGSGGRIAGHNVEIGYFSQTRLDVLSPENTVLQEAYSAAPGYMPEETIRTILGVFLFTGDDAEKKVEVLSGGEKSRLILAKLLIRPPNFLLLDEPTTHLDVDAVEALVRVLKEYEGTIVFISHDIYFVRSVANKVFEVKDGKVRKFAGNFDYYLDKKSEPEVLIAAAKPQEKPKAKRIDEAKLKAKEEEKRRREEEKKRKEHNAGLRSEIAKLGKEIEKLELESYTKNRALSNPRFYRDEETARAYGRRMKEIQQEISRRRAEIKELKEQLV